MEKNIFKNAYFGKSYKTRDGKKALYLRGNFKHHLYLETGGIIDCNQDGTFEGVIGRTENLDIVSEWKEEISEKELDKLAEEMYPYEYSTSLNASEEADYINDLREAFQKGYSAALKQ